jgi:predicted RNA-binding Zn-ribbon protein involved in translation (DUF1610 family)
MGMFDSLFVRCPACGSEIEMQSKAGDRLLHRFTPADVPPEIAGDVHGAEERCDACGVVVRVTTKCTVEVSIAPRADT